MQVKRWVLVRERLQVPEGCVRCCGHAGPEGEGANVDDLLIGLGLVLVVRGLASVVRRGGARGERPGFHMAQQGIEESISHDSPLGADTPDELAVVRHLACEEGGREDGGCLLGAVRRARREVGGRNVGPNAVVLLAKRSPSDEGLKSSNAVASRILGWGRVDGNLY
jgi:hypothetical protein